MFINKQNTECARFASKDEMRPNLNQVNITKRYTEATNGHVLCRVDTPTIDADDFPVIEGFQPCSDFESIAVSSEGFRKAGKTIPKAKHMPILKNARISYNGNGSAQIATTDLDSPSISTLRVDTENLPYPNTNDLLSKVMHSKEPKVTLYVNAKYLKEIGDFVCKLSDSSEKVIRLEIVINENGQSEIVWSAKNSATNQQADGILMGMRANDYHLRKAFTRREDTSE